MVLSERQGLLDRQAITVTQDHRGLLDPQARLDLKALLDQLATPGPLDRLGPMVSRVLAVNPAPGDRLEQRELVETMEPRELRVLRDHQEVQDLQVQQDRMDHRDQWVDLALKVLLDRLVGQVLLVRWDLMVLLDLMVTLAGLGQLAQ